jgi:hypothetical protein
MKYLDIIFLATSHVLLILAAIYQSYSFMLFAYLAYVLPDIKMAFNTIRK